MATPTLPDQLKRRDRDRLTRYTKALDFYNGNQWTGVAPKKARRLTINYARSIVHKATTALLKGRTTVVHPATPTNPSEDELARADAAETALNQVWQQNNLDSLDFDTEIDCAVLGDAAYKVFWDPQLEQVRVSSPDPAGVFVWHWPDDPSRFWRAANQYTLDRDATLTLFPGLPAKDKNTVTEAWTLDLYELWLNNEVATTGPNPYGFIPFVVFPNVREPKQLWGTSDLDTLYEPLQELNREITQLSLIMELSGNPIAALTGVTESEDIAVRPGEIWTLPPDAKAELLDLLRGGGPALHVEYVTALYRIIHDLAETPRAAFGDTGGRALSGVALELELDPLIKKTNRKRIIRTHAYRQRNDMILALLDQFTGSAFRAAHHDITWGSILPTDRQREVDDEIALVAAGVHSRRYAADTLGAIDDPDAEFARWLDEQRQLPTPPTAA